MIFWYLKKKIVKKRIEFWKRN